MRTEIVYVTPRMAAELLTRNKNNRVLSPKRVRRYADDMKAGRWQLTHQGISVFEDGTLADGQHRLRAICVANVTVPMLVTYDLPNGTSMIDRTKPRSVANILQLDGVPYSLANNEIVACANFLINMACGEGVPSEITIADFVAENADLFETVLKVIGGKKASSKQLTRRAACLAAAFCALYNGISPAYLEKFFGVVNSGFAEGNHESAAIVFRNTMLNVFGKGTIGRKESHALFNACTRAIHDYINCVPRRRAYTADTPVFWDAVKTYIVTNYSR